MTSTELHFSPAFALAPVAVAATAANDTRPVV